MASRFKLVFQRISQGKVGVLAHTVDFGSASLETIAECLVSYAFEP